MLREYRIKRLRSRIAQLSKEADVYREYTDKMQTNAYVHCIADLEGEASRLAQLLINLESKEKPKSTSIYEEYVSSKHTEREKH